MLAKIPTWIVVDLDGTVCDCAHRVHLAKAGQWDEFHDACKEDKPFPKIVQLLYALSDRYQLLFLSGRGEAWRQATTDWLEREMVPLPDALILRPKDNFEKDGVMKARALVDFFGSQAEAVASILLALDDRDQSVEALRNFGLTVLQVREGDY